MPSPRKSPAQKKSPAKRAARPQAAASARARIESNHRAIGRIAKSLEAAQKDLSAIGASLGTGAGDLRKDVAKLLRDARRDVTKMSTTVRHDLERLQKDVSVASKPKPRTRAASRTRKKGA